MQYVIFPSQNSFIIQNQAVFLCFFFYQCGWEGDSPVFISASQHVQSQSSSQHLGKDKRRKDMTSFGISQDTAIFRYFWAFSGVRGGPGDLLTLGRKNYWHIKNELVPVTFVNLIFRNFAWNDDVKSFFCIVGTSWMGWGRVEWYWHMGMSCYASLNSQLFKNIAYVGSFKHFSVELVLTLFCLYFATQTSPSLTAVLKRKYYEGYFTVLHMIVIFHTFLFS